MNDGYIHIPPERRNDRLYRFTTIERAVELLVTQKNVLVSPRKWDDPFENYLAKATFHPPDGEPFFFPFRDSIYGQCWTSIAESDAAWRIYAPNKNGIRLESDARRLLSPFEHSQPIYQSMSCFVGKVDYKTEDELRSLLCDSDALRKRYLFSGSMGYADSFLLKRSEFAHEQEVRIVFVEPNNHGHSDTYTYDCDPNALCHSLLLDPRMEENTSDAYARVFRSLGFNGPITQSRLYHPVDLDGYV